MVVWQGITEGGTAVPVQVTEEGKVVAIGEAGPTGPPGPEGPPGQAEWPANPFEGAFLVWLNGQPTWYAEQPIPIPGDLIGPIIEVPNEGTFTVASPIPQDIFYSGRRVVKANSLGIPIYENWNQSQVWTEGLSSSPYLDGGNWSPQGGFDGKLDKAVATYNSANFSWTGSLNFSKAEIRFIKESTSNATFKVTGANGQTTFSVAPINPSDISLAALVDVSGVGSPITEILIQTDNSGAAAGFSQVVINGITLVDEGIPQVPVASGNVATVVGNNILLSRIQGEIGVNDYLLAEPAQMAAWLATRRGFKVN